VLEKAVDDGGLEARGVIDQPAQIRAARRVVERRCQTGLGKQVGQIQRHRDLLGDQRIAMAHRWDLAHRIDREIGRLALLFRLHVEDFQRIGHAELLQQDTCAGRARVRRVIQDDVSVSGHSLTSSASR
jgi:hypothetical protein